MKTTPKLDSIYIITEVEYEYNDEYTYPDGEHPVHFATSPEAAKAWCQEKVLELCISKDWRTTKDVNDDTFDARWRWFFEEELGEPAPEYIEPYDVWEYDEIDYDKLIAWVDANGKDRYDYLPRTHKYYKVNEIP